MSLSVFVLLQMTNYGSAYVLTGWVFSNNAVMLSSLMHVVLILFCIFIILMSLIIPRPPVHQRRTYFQASLDEFLLHSV